jgi:hypothetical protein
MQEIEPLARQIAAEGGHPVMFPPGRLRLATKPSATGSPRKKIRSGWSRW